MLAAALATILAASAAVLWRSGYGSLLLNDHATGIGERIALQLPDGSALWLGARTAVDVAFDAGNRRLVLRRGRLFVRVSAETDRPFTVVAGGMVIGAVGTAFAVERRGEGGVSVAVAEHEVVLRWNGRELAHLPAGRQIRVDAFGKATAPRPIDRRAVAAWRQGRLVAEDETVGTVVESLADHRFAPILIPGRAVAALPVSAVLDLDDVDAALSALQAALPIDVQRLGPLLTLVLPASPEN